MAKFLAHVILIGIPFAIQHLKLAVISLAPIGQAIVDKEIAEVLRKREAENFVDRM